MPAPKSPREQYLKKRPGSQKWYLNYPIPTDLRHKYLTEDGNQKTHIVESLETTDLEVAYRKKLDRIRYHLADFDLRRSASAGTLPAHLVEAVEFRKSYVRAIGDRDAMPPRSPEEEAHDPVDDVFLVETLAQDRAEEIFAEGGKTPAAWKAAQTFYKVSTGSETLMEAFEDYLLKVDLPDRTRKKYRTAVEEFVSFLGDGHHLVAAMNKKNAIAYVDWLNAEGRSKRTKIAVPLSKNSKRDRIMALSVFWNQGLSARGKTTEAVNPWAKLKPTEKPTASAIKWDNKGNTGRPQRRSGFDDEELLAILNAPGPSEGRKTVYTKRTLMEVFCLGLLTGARPDELCSLRLKDVRERKGAFWLNIDDPKNDESVRRIPVVHPLGQGILRRRIGDREDGQAQLFEEFRAKKGHESLYELVGRALSRHLQRASDIAENAVPYCTRHTLQTNMVARPEVKGVVMERYVGHKPSNTGGKFYLTITPDMLLDFAKLISYAPDVKVRMAEELGIEVKATGDEVAKHDEVTA